MKGKFPAFLKMKKKGAEGSAMEERSEGRAEAKSEGDKIGKAKKMKGNPFGKGY